MSQGETLNTYMMLAQGAEICSRHGIRYAVLSPGSRSAPVALSFLRNKGIQCFVIPDERSAAYTAMGIARQTQSPVALICTSGTAALNYGPAIAEAFFSEIPLLLLTADRPPEWIGQADNQSIYQENIYGRHIKASFSIPVDLTHPDSRWFALRQFNEALLIMDSRPCGPVHINIPLREPLYLDTVPQWEFTKLPVLTAGKPEKRLQQGLARELRNYRKVLVAGGMMPPDNELSGALAEIISKGRISFLPDICSNLQHIPGSIPFAELVLDTAEQDFRDDLCPELLITFGGPVLSKTIKQYFRDCEVQSQWHIGPSLPAADTYQKLDKVIEIEPAIFFSSWLKSNVRYTDLDFVNLWQERQALVAGYAEHEMHEIPWSEISAMYAILRHLPQNSVLHLGNSLPVRYASVFPFISNSITVYGNRGTSGIDGSLSASAGHSMVDGRTHVLICGDLSFMYDSNGLWNNYLKSNLKIIVLNNHGGGIFRMLPGPAAQPELEDYFVVPQHSNFEHMALQYGCRYFYHHQDAGLKKLLHSFFAEKEKPAILELDFKEQIPMSRIKEKIRNQLKKG